MSHPIKYVPADQPEFKLIRQETARIFAQLPVGKDKGKTIKGRDLLCRLMEMGHVEVVAHFAIELMEQRQELCRVSGRTVPGAIYRQSVELAQWAPKKNQEGSTRRHRRPGKSPRPRPLTIAQTETVQIVGECKGNIAQAALRLGKNRKTVEEAYKAGLAKLGKEPVKRGTRTFARDRRGQIDLADGDNRRG